MIGYWVLGARSDKDLDQAGQLFELKCMLCGSHRFAHRFSVDGVRIVQCNRCTLVRSNRSRKTLWQYIQEYGANYFHATRYRGGYQDYGAEALSHERTFERRLLDAQRRLGRVGTLLDLGCAFGHLGQVARRLGWRTFGTDISVYAATRAYRQGELAFLSDVSRPCVRANFFDLICLYDVIEHLPDPVIALRRLRPLLKPDGLLHISTPDVESLSARLMGPLWYHYKPTEHIWYFSPRTLCEALTQAGFEVVHIGPLPTYMTVQDILIRLHFYCRWGADALLRCCRWLGVHHQVVRVNIGEMEAWAKIGHYSDRLFKGE